MASSSAGLDALAQLKQTLSQQQRQAAARAKAEAEHQAQLEAQRAAQSPELFRQTMQAQGVRPLPVAEPVGLPASRKPRKPDAPTLARRAAALGGPQLDERGLSDTQAFLNPVSSEARLAFRQATVQHRLFDQLKQGKLRWYEAVDLHGCTLEQARAAVVQLIELAKDANQTVVKIVHGKGPQAILKTAVNGWLRQHRDVLAFVSAPSEQGGTGAVLVLIKRQQPLGAAGLRGSTATF